MNKMISPVLGVLYILWSTNRLCPGKEGEGINREGWELEVDEKGGLGNGRG